MATYTQQELQDRLKRSGTRFYTVKNLGDDSYDFITGFEDFGSAAKAGGRPQYDVAVVNDDGTYYVVSRSAPDFFDYGKTREAPPAPPAPDPEE